MKRSVDKERTVQLDQDNLFGYGETAWSERAKMVMGGGNCWCC
jgi:hypothetical protein